MFQPAADLRVKLINQYKDSRSDNDVGAKLGDALKVAASIHKNNNQAILEFAEEYVHTHIKAEEQMKNILEGKAIVKEEKIIQQLEEYDIKPNYESVKLEYTIPESKHIYTPDFPVCKSIVIETKGRWVLEDRQKMLLIIEQHPEIEFRMLFYNANQKIKKGSKTSYADWCDKHGIKWADKKIPPEWIEDICDAISREKF